MHKIISVCGGIRSGKSCFAESLATYYSDKPVYLATAIPFDEEMKKRVKTHQKRREEHGYELIEEPEDITIPLRNIRNRTVLVDCLTLNLSNRMLRYEKHPGAEEEMKRDLPYLEEIVSIIKENNLKVIFVSNDVGNCPVEVNRLSRIFQDLMGKWNCFISSEAHEVYMVKTGIPELIKKEPCAPFRISAPSYTIPGTYLENTVYLHDKVDDIQLLVYDYTENDPLMKADTLSCMEYMKRDSNLSFTVHMPLNIFPWKSMEKDLKTSSEIIKKLDILKPLNHTFHFEPENPSDIPGAVIQSYVDFFCELKQIFPKKEFTLENVNTDLKAFDTVIENAPVKRCIDIGHMLKSGFPLEQIRERAATCSVIHLHGLETKEGITRDHRAVQFSREIFSMLENFRGILTIEVFHPDILRSGLKTIKKYF